MSIHLHFRAVAEPDIRDDHTWLAAFMSEAWSRHAEEYAAGIARSINKTWTLVDDLYAAARVIAPDPHEPWTLPVYGGRPVPHTPDADPSDPPLMLLEPPGVARAASFLTHVSFDALWNAAGARFSTVAGAREELLEHHQDLVEFYARAASSGHAVVKAVWA
ncbi:DUF1877 family protein [Streptomyces griseosporeus]|uniref:DUF1877 family protein n=1 Tax=Streptomyces griseosporeus TaxID=1910 RepID=UPI0036FA190C